MHGGINVAYMHIYNRCHKADDISLVCRQILMRMLNIHMVQKSNNGNGAVDDVGPRTHASLIDRESFAIDSALMH